MRPMMIIDLLAFLPWYVHKILPFDFRALRLLRLFRLLKLIRYSPTLQTLKRVVAHEWRALLGALLLMMMLLVFASTIIYFLERSAQPEYFGGIPASAWWTLETLTTVGYGDVTPITPLGKGRRHRHAVWALHVRFARRHHSHRLQSRGGAARIRGHLEHGGAVCRCSQRLTLPRWPKLPSCSTPARSSQGALIVSTGEPGGAMYLIGSGEATVCVVPRTPHQAERGRLLRRDGADRASPPQA
jgi:Ion transport protein